MTTDGLHIPDDVKVEVPEGEWADEDTWIELTNNKGVDPDDEQ